MNTLILLAPIRPAREHGLRKALAAIDGDPLGNPYVRIAASASTHFARWVIVPGDLEGDAPRLLFCANYDGCMLTYVDQLVEVSPGLDAIWGACEGFAAETPFVSFVRTHFLRPRGVYPGLAGLTVQGASDLIALRQQLEDALDEGQATGVLDGARIELLLARATRLRGRRTLAQRAAAAVDAMAANAAGGLRDRLLPGALAVARWYAERGQPDSFALVHGGCPPGEPAVRETDQRIQTVALGEGTVQSEMTTVTEIRPERLRRVRVALAGTTVLARYGWPPGQFADVGTLHWFGWALLDGGSRLLFMSVFDGSWQNYMQDFIDKLVWGLDALYGNTRGYPAAGMKDVASFTEFILDHQYPSEVFYSAYPGATVSNLLNDRAIAAGVSPSSGREAVDRWLLQL